MPSRDDASFRRLKRSRRGRFPRSWPRWILSLGLLATELVLHSATAEGAWTQVPIRVSPHCAAPNASFLVEVNLLPRKYDDRVIHRVLFDAAVVFSENVPTWTPSWSRVVSVQDASQEMHIVRFEQLELHDAVWYGTACAYERNIEITLDPGPNPWSEEVSADSIHVFFDPTDVCGIPPCEQIQRRRYVSRLHEVAMDAATRRPTSDHYV